MNQWELQQAAQSHTTAQDWSSAQHTWQQLTAANPLNGMFWQELGKAYYQQKAYQKAIAAYETAIELRPVRPFLLTYNIACCYALLEDTDSALTWLERAFEIGFNDMKLAQTDEDLKSLHTNARFRALVELVDTESMSREQGLRSDLDLLVHQLKRLGYAPFRVVTEAEFDVAVQSVHASIPNLTDTQVILKFGELLQMAGDGHTRIDGRSDCEDFRRNVPLEYYLYEEGLFITRAAPKYESLLGLQVKAMDGHPAEAVLEALHPIISRDNSMWLKHMAPIFSRNVPMLHALSMAEKTDKINLTVCDNTGKTQNVTVLAEDTTPIWYDVWHKDEWLVYPKIPHTMVQQYINYWFEYDTDSKLLFFQFNQVRNMESESLAEFAEKLFNFIDTHEVDKLVIDVRYNTGGNTYLHMPILNRLIGSSKINRKGHFFVLIGRRTFSAAMNFVTLLDRHTNVIFVGEPTGSSPNFIGESIMTELPYSKVNISISDLYWQSSWPTDERPWIAPDYYVPPTFADISTGCDEALDAVRMYPTAE